MHSSKPANPDSALLAEQLARVALGDRAAFRRVYELSSAHLFGVALRILNRRDLAEEVLQESFVSVWHKAGDYQASMAAPMTWLISVVRNRALDLVRSAAQRHETALPQDEDGRELDIEDGKGDLLDMLGEATEALSVRGCMDALDAPHRQSLALAYYHGLSHSEVAEQMAAPLGSVKAWVRRGLDRLKRCLEAQA
ncbi:sigma-70 family RNA polymerase sigma factor [Viridibacterium curvum]|uniref:RNA polymerase sigma factor n=1 Tax=Viridibacterium curvum TaxID=1101404 RepID=A0ABP9QS44_9RHOO